MDAEEVRDLTLISLVMVAAVLMAAGLFWPPALATRPLNAWVSGEGLERWRLGTLLIGGLVLMLAGGLAI